MKTINKLRAIRSWCNNNKQDISIDNAISFYGDDLVDVVIEFQSGHVRYVDFGSPIDDIKWSRVAGSWNGSIELSIDRVYNDLFLSK